MKNNSHYTLCTTDLMMGLLFIFIILLVSFMIKFKNQEQTSKNKEQTYDVKIKDLSKPVEARNTLLLKLKNKMKKENIQVEVDQNTGVLVLKDFYYFKKGGYELSEKGKESFKKIRRIFFSELVCYSDFKNKEVQLCKNRQHCHNTHSQWQTKTQKTCGDKKDKYGLLDTVLIEGHADSTPIGDLMKWEDFIKSNMELAMHRSLNVFKFLLDYKEKTSENPESGNDLYILINKNKKPLFGVSSFGNLRRNTNNREPSSQTQKKDRRIEFRFIMSQPEELKKHLKN